MQLTVKPTMSRHLAREAGHEVVARVQQNGKRGRDVVILHGGLVIVPQRQRVLRSSPGGGEG